MWNVGEKEREILPLFFKYFVLESLKLVVPRATRP
jgi:hypothetical protein